MVTGWNEDRIFRQLSRQATATLPDSIWRRRARATPPRRSEHGRWLLVTRRRIYSLFIDQQRWNTLPANRWFEDTPGDGCSEVGGSQLAALVARREVPAGHVPGLQPVDAVRFCPAILAGACAGQAPVRGIPRLAAGQQVRRLQFSRQLQFSRIPHLPCRSKLGAYRGYGPERETGLWARWMVDGSCARRIDSGHARRGYAGDLCAGREVAVAVI